MDIYTYVHYIFYINKLMKQENSKPSITISEESSFSAFFNATEEPKQKTQKKKETEEKEQMEIAVKISLDTKLRLQAILQHKQRQTGKFIALNRFINGILNEWIAENE